MFAKIKVSACNHDQEKKKHANKTKHFLLLLFEESLKGEKRSMKKYYCK